MKTTFFVTGLFFAIIAIIIDSTTRGDVSIGYFLLSSVMMICSTIYKTDHTSVMSDK
jgi:hypothetical protein